MHSRAGLAHYVLLKPLCSCRWRNPRIQHVLHGKRLGHFAPAQRQLVLVVTFTGVSRHRSGFGWLLSRGLFRLAQCRARKFLAGEQLALRAGFDFVGLGQQVRSVGQTGKLFAGGCIFSSGSGLALFLRTHALNVALRVQGHLLAKFGNTGLDFRGLLLLFQTFALLCHVGVLALVVEVEVLLAFGHTGRSWLRRRFWCGYWLTHLLV